LLIKQKKHWEVQSFENWSRVQTRARMSDVTAAYRLRGVGQIASVRTPTRYGEARCSWFTGLDRVAHHRVRVV